MTKLKGLGIWMDHASAHLMPFEHEVVEATIIESTFTHQDKEESLSKSESLMHHKEQQQQGDYYQKLGDKIMDYESVVLFGSTDAKVELFNILRADKRYADIVIETKNTDKMTTKQEHAFVKAFFSRQ